MTKQDDDLRPFKLIGLPIIPFMLILATLGIVLTVLLQHYFPQLV